MILNGSFWPEDAGYRCTAMPSSDEGQMLREQS
jgi:hypothetical protein